ncbi:hypothetical protein M2139_002647 [Enterococcus sp. PF1-24]|uniref:DUF2922 domain-containing protein n=1 Tax=unclassified Enterococcus TaxID=2608891 RepID=UPI002473C1FA|nr:MULTISPECIES: DUF2922 domain-containing protein [unclassified Enterococcus]MDH6365640.1 hypothetical protein [Enterococcus sp. PFB1-1]MDH6402741.1 hypothetical protein [Enterococcus sp. PF1-24]
MKQLKLSFLDSEGKKHQLVPKIAADNLSAAVVREKMTALSQLEIFKKADVVLYKSVDSAKYVETIETPLF